MSATSDSVTRRLWSSTWTWGAPDLWRSTEAHISAPSLRSLRRTEASSARTSLRSSGRNVSVNIWVGRERAIAEATWTTCPCTQCGQPSRRHFFG